ncbi:DUF1441 family protein [Escherichia coli]|nr:DUF1441 family protein [Escherichia coli]EHX8893681.1 DUF1441 family protein [Escherichia coli]EJK6122948.1 DUF1441 family protein [Escherichia coli]HBB2453043.1 DUF1441 family protein [Escherichia coli]
MKLAPNVKKQPRGIKNKDTEVIIFAGSDAWSHAQQWQEKDGPASGDNVPPVWLGPNQLAELDALKIVPDGKKRVRLYQAGELDLVEIKKIGQKLAAADIQDANFYPEGMHGQKCENWRRYLNVERQNLSADLVIKLPVKKKATTSPGDDELKPRVESRADGVFWVTPKVDKQSGEIIRPETWLCSPLELLGTGTIGKEHYRVMRWKKPANHEVITMAIPCGGIGDRDGWRLLKDHGLNVTTNGKYRAIPAVDVHRELVIFGKILSEELAKLPDILARDAGINQNAVNRVRQIIDDLCRQITTRVIQANDWRDSTPQVVQEIHKGE